MHQDNQALQAIVQGLKDGGCQYVTNFPGFKSHDIFFELGGDKISANEFVAYCMAFGGSLAGKRTVVTMKNVGLNVASDPFLHSVISGVNAGLVIIVTDDVDVVASTERQDSRHFFDFFGGLWFEPANVQAAYDYAYSAFEFSERFDVPVVIRLTNDFFQQSGTFEKKSKKDATKDTVKDAEKFVLYPTYWKKQYLNLLQKNERIEKFVEELYVESSYRSENGKVYVGAVQNEEGKEGDILMIHTYPIPKIAVKNFLTSKKKLQIYEKGDNYVMNKIKEMIAEYASVKIIDSESSDIVEEKWIVWDHLSLFFESLSRIEADFVIGDVGQFTVETTHCINACLCLGSAVAIGTGFAASSNKYPFVITGDTAFLSGGMISLEEAISRGVDMGVVVIDNNGSMATGGQELVADIYNISPSVNKKVIHYKDLSISSCMKILKDMRSAQGVSVLFIKY